MIRTQLQKERRRRGKKYGRLGKQALAVARLNNVEENDCKLSKWKNFGYTRPTGRCQGKVAEVIL